MEKLLFQWAPTLGGECYTYLTTCLLKNTTKFQLVPTLGGECYKSYGAGGQNYGELVSMGTHPWG